MNHIRNTFRRLLLVCGIYAATSAGLTSAAYADVQLPPAARITDTTGTLTPAQIQTLTLMSRNLERDTKATVLTLMLPTMGGTEDIESLGIRAAEKYTPGLTADANSAILIIVKDDHKVRIEVNRFMGQTFTDVESSRVLGHMKPLLATGQYADAVALFYAEIRPFASGPVTTPTPEEPYNIMLVVFFFAGGALLVVAGVMCWGKLMDAKEEETARQARMDEERRRGRRNAISEMQRKSHVPSVLAASSVVPYDRTPVVPYDSTPSRPSEPESESSSILGVAISVLSSAADVASSAFDSLGDDKSFDGGGSSSDY